RVPLRRVSTLPPPPPYRRRQLQQVRQSPPRQRPLTVQPARRRPLQPLEHPLRPVLDLVASLRLLALQVLLRPEQPWVLGGFRDLVVLQLPAQELHVVLVGQGVDVAAVVVLRPAGPAEDLVGRARVDQLLLAERTFH